MGANVIDLTDVRADDPTNHDKFAQLAEVAPQFRDVLGKGIGNRHGPLAETRAAAGASLGSLVTLPITLVGAPLRMIAGE